MFKLIIYTTKTYHFEIKNAKIFWGGGHPSPGPTINGAQAQRDTPEKILVVVLIKEEERKKIQ